MPATPVHDLQHRRRFERREREQQQERGHELRPHEEREPQPGHPGCPQLDDRRDEVDRPEQRRGDQEDHPEQPPGLPGRRDGGERHVGGPARVGRAAGDEEARQHDHAADEEHPVARHVEPGERHVGGADLQRDHVVAEAADRERHDAEEDHDRAVHRAELVVELRQHDAARRVRHAQQVADERDRLARIGQLPPHQHHQAETEEQEQQRRDRVLDPDDFVVDREDGTYARTEGRARARVACGRGPHGGPSTGDPTVKPSAGATPAHRRERDSSNFRGDSIGTVAECASQGPRSSSPRARK